MSTTSIVALLGAFMLGVAIWLAWPTSEPTPSITPADADAPAGAAAEPRAAAPLATAQVPSETPPSGLSSPEATERRGVPELEARAERGDPQAMLALARLLSDCAEFEPMAPEARDEALAELNELQQALLQRFTAQPNLDAALQVAIETGEALEARCGGLELPPKDARIPQARHWGEQAALAGNSAAQLEWVAQFRLRWNDPRLVARNAEQVRVERMRARAYLDNGLAQREPYALFLQASAHISGDLDRIDHARAYAQLSAWRQLGAPGPMLVPRLLSQAQSSLRQQLSPEQLDWSEQEADRLAREFSR